MEIPRLCRGGSSSLTFPGVPRSGSVVSSHSHERNRTDGRVRDAKPHDVGLQIPRCLHPEISAQAPVSGVEETAGRSFPSARGSERSEGRRGAFASGPCSHAFVDPTKIRGVERGRVHQGKERDPSGADVRRTEAQFRGAKLLGARLFCEEGWTRRKGDPGIHTERREGQPTAGATTPLEVTATFRWPMFAEPRQRRPRPLL